MQGMTPTCYPAPHVRRAIDAKAKTALIDRNAQEIGQKCLNGSITDREARWEIAELVEASAIVEEVIQPLKSTREKYEMKFALTEFLQNKIIEPGSNGYNFQLAQGASLCGWARKMTAAALRSKQRDFRYAESRMIPVSPMLDTKREANASAVEMRFHNYQTPEYDQHTEEVLSKFEAGKKNARGVIVIHNQASAVSAGFGIPLCVRPLDYSVRLKLLALLEEDESLAADSATEYLRLTYGIDSNGYPVSSSVMSEATTIEPTLLALWESYKQDDLEVMLGMDAQIAHALALASVLDMARPKKNLQIEMHRNLALAGKGKGWKTVVVALVESFVALECQTASEWHSPAAQRLSEMETARTIAQRNWTDRVQKVSAWKGSPLGSTEGDIHRACFKMLNAVMASTGDSFILAIGEAAEFGEASA